MIKLSPLTSALVATAAMFGIYAFINTPSESKAAPIKPVRRVSLDQKATTRSYPAGPNELVVINFPESVGGSTDIRQCFIWRDAEFKTSSMQCPTDTAGDIPYTSGTEANPAY